MGGEKRAWHGNNAYEKGRYASGLGRKETLKAPVEKREKK